MTTTFNKNVSRDFNLGNSNGAVFSDIQYDVTLASGVAQSVTVPESAGMGGSVATKNKFLAVMRSQSGARVRVSNSGTATNPGGSFATTSSELLPGDGDELIRYVVGGTTLSFITNDTNADIWVGFYFVN